MLMSSEKLIEQAYCAQLELRSVWSDFKDSEQEQQGKAKEKDSWTDESNSEWIDPLESTLLVQCNRNLQLTSSQIDQPVKCLVY